MNEKTSNNLKGAGLIHSFHTNQVDAKLSWIYYGPRQTHPPPSRLFRLTGVDINNSSANMKARQTRTTSAIPSLRNFFVFRVRGMPVEERRNPIHGGLAAAKRQGWRVLGNAGAIAEEQKFAPAVDILAKHTPHPFLFSNWELLVQL
ncbi:MAG: hypothetical protein KJ725_16665 [Gammaproteobacteria bacterium]|uniref:hypothetical protein n=1 Tax=Methylotuvimicrobium sp. TaxID=2822413 RepID=UPI001DD427DE|nr:hypothetical protein [Gammaproteobacteria bacterium]